MNSVELGELRREIIYLLTTTLYPLSAGEVSEYLPGAYTMRQVQAGLNSLIDSKWVSKEPQKVGSAYTYVYMLTGE